jgi:DNA repair photolyase
VAIVTKNRLVTRDLDLLTELARHNAALVYLSLTTLDTELRGVLEPRTSPPTARLAAVRALSAAGVPVGVLVAPVIPGLNDHELPALLAAAAAAGARHASYSVLRLPHALAGLFERWLETHVPDRKERVLYRIRSLRGGALNDSQFDRRMEGEGVFAEQISRLFEVGCRRCGLNERAPELSVAAFRRREPDGQMRLFDPG